MNGEVYLVGGAVRDALLGRPVHERDWLVVGATARDLLAEGYRQVGRDFPVFLHPETHEEYALARTERKRGRGHHGFEIDASPEVTLEQDLVRRDLTINAMAQSADGRVFDPYGGERDLQARVLRHVSPAFVEDPLRVFRVARFAAQLAPYGFTVAPETRALMREMAADDELAALSAQRVWAELGKALLTQAPRFIEVLAAADALAPWFVEWRGVTVPAVWPAVLEPANDWQLARGFAALAAALSEAQLQRACAVLGPPRQCVELARLLVTERQPLARWRSLDDEALLALWQRCDAYRRADRFAALAQLSEQLDGVAAAGVAELLDAVVARRIELRGVVDPARAQHHARLAALAELRSPGR